MKQANKYLREAYLDFFNNYLTVEKWAEHNEIHPTDARRLLSMGKHYHEQYVELMRGNKA